MIDGFADWFEDNKYFQPTTDLDQVLAQPIKIACLPVFFNVARTNYLRQTVPEDIVDRFDLILLSIIQFHHIKLVDFDLYIILGY